MSDSDDGLAFLNRHKAPTNLNARRQKDNEDDSGSDSRSGSDHYHPYGNNRKAGGKSGVKLPTGFNRPRRRFNQSGSSGSSSSSSSDNEAIGSMPRNISNEQLGKGRGGGKGESVRDLSDADVAEMKVPERPYHAQYDSFEEKEETKDPNWCYLCEFGQSEGDAQKNTHHQGLLRLIHEHYPLMGCYEFTRTVQNFYNLCLRFDVEGPKTEPGYKPMVWTRHSILDHVQKHAPPIPLMHEEVLRTLYAVTLCIRDNGLFVYDRVVHRHEVDPKHLGAFLRVVKELNTQTRIVMMQRPNSVG